MKKFLLSAITMVVALAANAATAVETTVFQGKLGIDITGEGIDMDDASDATITVSKMDDGTYTFVLNQFSFGGMLIGDATVSGLAGEDKDGAVVLSAEDYEAPVTNGGDIAAVIGGKVVMTMTATIKDGKMTADINKIEVNMGGQILPVAARFESVSSETTDIDTVRPAAAGEQFSVYDLSGRQLPAMQKGLNIVKAQNGKTVKVMK